MTKITIDSETRSKLDGVREPAELCDESGNKVGYFVPPGLLKHLSPYSDAEIEELRKQRTGRPLEDILRDLECPP